MEKKSMADKLQELYELHTSGALTEDEYKLLKSELLGKEKSSDKTSQKKQADNAKADPPKEMPNEEQAGTKEPELKQEKKEEKKEPVVMEQEQTAKTDTPKKEKPAGKKKMLLLFVPISLIAVAAVVIIFLLPGQSDSKGKQDMLAKDFDGNIYHTLVLGNQEWMVENLKTTHFNDGTPIPLVTEADSWRSLTSPAFCWYNNDEISHKDSDGALYNWYAVNSQKLCPEGWHVPSETEWKILTDYLAANGYGFQGGSNNIGKSMAATSGWNPASETAAVGNDPSANNKSGFTAFPSGIRFSNGEFRHSGENGKWWSATETSEKAAQIRYISWNDGLVSTIANRKENGFSVRCVRFVDSPEDQSPSPNNSKSGYKSGVWDDEAAKDFILADLSKNEENSPGNTDYQVLGFTKMKLDTKELILALAGSSSTYQVYEFEKRNEWEFTKKSTAFDFYPEMAELTYVAIAPDNYAVEIEMGEGAAGSFYVSKTIFAFINGDFKEIFTITHRWVSAMNDAHEFLFEVIPRSTGYYDIETFNNENYDGDNYRMHKTYIYGFNGSAYVKKSEGSHAYQTNPGGQNIEVSYESYDDDNLSLDEVEELRTQFLNGVKQTPYSSYSDYEYKLNFNSPYFDQERGFEPDLVSSGYQRGYFIESENVCIQKKLENSVETEVILFHPDGRIYNITKMDNGMKNGFVKFVDLNNTVILEGNYRNGKLVGFWNTPVLGNFDTQNAALKNQYPGVVNQMLTLIHFYEYDKDSRIFYMN